MLLNLKPKLIVILVGDEINYNSGFVISKYWPTRAGDLNLNNPYINV